MFTVTQHINGIDILNSFRDLFNAGAVTLKSGSDNIYHFTLKGYTIIIPNVLPFAEEFIVPFSCKLDEYNTFKYVIEQTAAGGQKNKETLIKLVKIVYTLEAKGTKRKRELSEILSIIEDKTTYFNSLKNNK
jgi:hypothetical protein